MGFGKKNSLGLDAMLAVDEVFANQYFGRTDVPPEPVEGRVEALSDVAKGKAPEIDRSLPWPLLVRGMFKILYKDAIKVANQQSGRKKRESHHPMPGKISVSPNDWASAFNIITTSYVKTGLLKRPQVSERLKTISGRTVSLAVLVQGPGKGKAKMAHYLSSKEKTETIRIIRRMETHRKTLAGMGSVKKYLAGLQAPTVAA